MMMMMSTTISSTSNEHLSTFILLTAVRKILYLDSSAKGRHSYTFMATFNNFILLTAKCRPTTIQRKQIVVFKWQQWLFLGLRSNENSEFYPTGCILYPFSKIFFTLFLQSLSESITGKNLRLLKFLVSHDTI